MGRRVSVQAVAQLGASILLGAAALVLGMSAEAQSYSWGDTRHWIPDLATGLGVLVCAGSVWSRTRSTSLLLAATGASWFLGNFHPDLLYLHRGPLVHLLLTFPGSRPRAHWVKASVAGAYLAAVVPVWGSELASVVAAVVVVGLVSVRARTSTPPQRGDRDRALVAAAVLSAAVGGGAIARLAVPSGVLVDPTLLLYEGALIVVAVLLAARARRIEQPQTVDRVVELGGAAPSGLRGALADVLGDSRVEVGYRTPDGSYVDDEGRLVGSIGHGRAATYVERGGEPVALLVHDRAVLQDPELVRALSEAIRLATAHAQLRTELQAQLADLGESRQRLLVAEDDERQRMRERLVAGPGRRLVELDVVLTSALARHPAGEHLQRADLYVRQALTELDHLAAGLHSTELAHGLTPALTSLAARSAIVVELDARVGRVDARVERAAYFACAEALSNVAKHARTGRAAVVAEERDERIILTVMDDGVGGANPRGGGLQGLADRLDAIGGTLHVTSPAGAGTRLTVEIPVAASRG